MSQDDFLSRSRMTGYCSNALNSVQMTELNAIIDATVKKVQGRTAWRIDGTLREFPKFDSVNVYFDYPIHVMDDVGCLKDLQTEVDKVPAWQKKQKTPDERKKEKDDSLRIAFEANDLEKTGRIKITDLVDYMGVTLNTVKKYVDSSKHFKRENGMVVRVSKVSNAEIDT